LYLLERYIHLKIEYPVIDKSFLVEIVELLKVIENNVVIFENNILKLYIKQPVNIFNKFK